MSFTLSAYASRFSLRPFNWLELGALDELGKARELRDKERERERRRGGDHFLLDGYRPRSLLAQGFKRKLVSSQCSLPMTILLGRVEQSVS